MRNPLGPAALGAVAATAVLGSLVTPPWQGDAATAPTCQGQPATIVGTSHGDDIVGTNHRDVIVALGGNDLVHGRGGNDLVCGGEGADKLFGGPGNDRLFGELAGIGFDRGGGSKLLPDQVDGGTGDDYLDPGADARTADLVGSPGRVSYLTATGDVHVRLDLGRAWGMGADTIHVVPDMQLWASSYADTVVGSEGADDITGGTGDDTIRGLGGDDVLKPESVGHTGPADDDVVYGGSGADDIIGWKGRDRIYGGSGDDQVGSFSFQPTKVFGQDGSDWVMTSVTNAPGYRIDGGPGVDSGRLTRRTAGSTGDPGATIQVRMSTGELIRAGSVIGHIGTVESVELADDLRWSYFGTAGVDQVTGGRFFAFRAMTYAGADVVTGTSKDDYIDTGSGADTVDAQRGYDTCLHAETVHSCEVTSP